MTEINGCIDADLFRVSCFDDIDERIPLIGKFLHVPRGLDCLTHIVPCDGQFIKLFFSRIIVKHNDGSPPGR